MKKFFIIFICLFIIVVCFINLNNSKYNSTVIKFSFWGSQSEIAMLKPLIKQFERQNPDITIEVLHIPQNYFQKLHLLFASNLAPDVIFINNYYLPKYVKAGLLEDLTYYVKQEDYFDKSLENFTYDKKIYAIPRDISSLVVYYNKNLFDKYKVSYPNENWTIAEYLYKAKKFAANGVWGTSYETDVLFWLPYLMSNGACILSDDGQGVGLDTKEAVDSLDFYAALANVYKVAPQKSDSAGLTMAQLFLQQRLAMHVSGRWLVPKYRTEADFDWDVVSFPKGSAGSIVNIDASGYALAKNSKHKKEALRFIEFITSNESLSALTRSGLIIPARKDTAYSDIFLDKTQKPVSSEVFLKTIKTGKVTPVNENYQKINDILNTGLEPLFLGKEKARNLVDNGLLIDLSRYAY